MLVNRTIQVDDITDESGDVTEPATLSEVKGYLRLQGFTADDDSGASEFIYDDDRLTDMISEGRLWVEKYTGLHVVPKTLSVLFQNQSGGYQLPGPVTGTPVFTDRSDVVIDAAGYVILGTSNVETRFCDRVKAVYTAGYTEDTRPKWVKRAILAYIAWMYENKGDEDTGSPLSAAAICRPHRRVSVWA